MWSHTCMAAEAKFLNRTLIYDPRFCNNKEHILRDRWATPEDVRKWGHLRFHEYMDALTPKRRGETHYTDALSNHVDTTRLETLPAISKDEWLFGAPCDPAKLAGGHTGPFEASADSMEPTRELKTNVEYALALLLVRGGTWRKAGPGAKLLYWYDVCAQNEELKRLRVQTYNWFVSPPAVVRASDAVKKLLGANFTGVHVRRGDKVRICGPRLDAATQPANIAKVLLSRGVVPGSSVYIASNEGQPGFFQRPPLSTTFRVFTAESFKSVIGGAVSVNYMLFDVEERVVKSAARSIETFEGGLTDLPRQCKHAAPVSSKDGSIAAGPVVAAARRAHAAPRAAAAASGRAMGCLRPLRRRAARRLTDVQQDHRLAASAVAASPARVA
eukprot:CAMPEP_0206042380 /NCGR_PEP_ID=MMETSP1466-20131121/6519_1 /ASSEMBLY_ACC=CAM_ASM_001126 /TAXON_ID=44452 /ORGANISM="Pavlova gyrans, Strain CCMP608" /LENGTH=385 /DNA_ID=CAMNT_0053417089 /DNA_START=15 /DNA_END=1170 /DNA_ORIENTATION=-